MYFLDFIFFIEQKIYETYLVIPIEQLDPNRSYEVRILYYNSPSRFYVYLRKNINAHAEVKIDYRWSWK